MISFQQADISKNSFEGLKDLLPTILEMITAQNISFRNSGYNDFSGGYKRFYKLIPEDMLKSEAKSVILQFKRYYNIPDGTIMLVQIQSSIIEPSTSLSSSRTSVTGQGIHTDGHSQAILVCLERKNVSGAENSFFKDLNGTEQIGKGKILNEGDAVLFRDNELYHYVSPALPKDTSKLMRRSVMLVHSPADNVLDGTISKENSLGRRESFVKLRNEQGGEVKKQKDLDDARDDACAEA
eukprot:scaffold1769_cov132-Skeletonema_dohrnii-CCMP3373.AAC.15